MEHGYKIKKMKFKIGDGEAKQNLKNVVTEI
jgi:hypothetical protein